MVLQASVKPPWRIARDTFGCLRIWDAEGTMIAGIHEDEWDDQTVNEHANLIAAAPELLAACERIARPRECGCNPCRGQCMSQEVLIIEADEMRELARAAISKARGQ